MNVEDVTAIRKLIEETYPTNAMSGDARTYASAFTEDALWAPPDMIDRRGPDEIATGFDTINAAFTAVVTAEEIEVMDGFAYVVGRSEGTITPNDGSEPCQFLFRVIWLLQKQAGDWKIARQVWNSKPL
jgi:uncharacterized protein (TIGR02246 family)